MDRILRFLRDEVIAEGSISLVTDSHIVKFGKERNRDLVVVSKGAFGYGRKMFYGKEERTIKNSQAKTLLLYVKDLMQVDAAASVSMSARQMQDLKNSISKIDATHLRFFSKGDRLRVVIFDYFKFHSSYRLPRKTSNLVNFIDTLIVAKEEFSTTFLADSFMKLPTVDTFVRIGCNGVTRFSPDKSEQEFLMRDQELKEPIATFYSAKVQKNICFVFHPKSDQ
jgi:hypothetical protein